MPPKQQPGVCLLHPYMDERLDNMEKKIDIIVEYITTEKALKKDKSKKNDNFLKLKYIIYGALATGLVGFIGLIFMRLVEFYTFL